MPGQQAVAIEVEIADQRHVDTAGIETLPDRRHRAGGLLAVDRDTHQFGSSPRQRNDLRDRRGALVELDLIVNGVWYNEGAYDGTGNLPVYGSILMKSGFTATGSPDVYFNEGLVLGDWPPAEMQIPRVYVSHVDVE